MLGVGGQSKVIPTRSRHRRRVRLLARVLVPLTALAGVTVATQMAADASTPTAMLGNTSFGETAGTPAVSACPAGDFAVGAQIGFELPRDEEGAPQYTTGIALFCRDASGNISSAPTAALISPDADQASSMCNPGDLAVGLYGLSGQVMDAIGIRCSSSSGTYDAPLVGGTGGSPAGPADCPAANALTSVTVWSGDYFGLPDLYGIQGACDATDTSLAITPGVSSTVNATGPAGAIVSFKVPTASDDDGPVPVSCAPASGSLFGLGPTTVTCTATDLAAFPSTVSTTLLVDVLAVAPLPPVLDSATGGNASASVAFEAPAWDGSNPITSYTASCTSTDGGASAMATGPQSPLAVQGLSSNHAYTCVVRATNHIGTSLPSRASDPIVIGGVVTCFTTQTCTAGGSTQSSASNPPLVVNVTGVVTGAVGTIQVATLNSTLHCPGAAVGSSTATSLTDSGFSSNLTASVKLLAVATGPGKICYSSDVPFRSETSPTTPQAGTAFLLACTAVGNQAPCVVSISSGPNAVVAKVLIPAGDPAFSIVVPKGRLLWPSNFPKGKVGTPYSEHMQSKGGKAPFKWKVASGKLAPGLTLGATTGAVTGKPTTKGTFKCVVQVNDSESPPKSANISVSITIS
jgi:hypothetical protein